MNSLSLSGDCTIYEISEIHQQVLQAWKKKKGLTLDLSEVADIDASFMQLLLSCRQSAQQQQQLFELKNIPQQLSEKLESLYLSEWFSEPEEKTLESSEAASAEGEK